jgi:magnesium chelatase family protein
MQMRSNMKVYAPLNTEPVPKIQEVEIATLFQLPSFQIIGLPSPEVAEAKERIRSAIGASGLEFPKKKVILNLSPASVRKRGTGLDLAMALSVLSLNSSASLEVAAWGELGLDGAVKPCGQLTRTLYAIWEHKIPYLFISSSEYEAAVEAKRLIQLSEEFSTPCPVLIPVDSLNEAWNLISTGELDKVGARTSVKQVRETAIDAPFASLLPISPALERMLCVAATGSHHFLLLGPRGVGKSHLLEWFMALQPPSTARDQLSNCLLSELSAFNASVRTGNGVQGCPVRRISSQVRPAALVGGATASTIRPGEFSLAHGGVLIADELPEWPSDSREILREPLERGKVTLTRTLGSFELPARFLLAANGNLCPCGGWTHSFPISNNKAISRCKCPESSRKAYLARLSGPILDRIDLVALVSSFDQNQRLSVPSPERMNHQKLRILKCRKRLNQLWGELPAHLSGSELETILQGHKDWSSYLDSLALNSLRSRHKVVRIALSLSVWDELEEPSLGHFVEASCYRPERLLLD